MKYYMNIFILINNNIQFFKEKNDYNLIQSYNKTTYIIQRFNQRVAYN